MGTTTALRIRREIKAGKGKLAKKVEPESVDLEANAAAPRSGNHSTASLPKSSVKSVPVTPTPSTRGPQFGINALHQDHAQNGIPMTPTARPGPEFRDSQRSSITISPSIFRSDNTSPLAQSSSPRYPPRPYCSSVEDISMMSPGSPGSCTSSCFVTEDSMTRSDPRSDRTPPRPQRNARAVG